MNPQLKQFIADLEEAAPVAFHAAHPRNITPPTGYCNPRYYAASLVANLEVVRQEDMRQLPHCTGYMTSLALLANRVPTYFIAYEFAEAVANTDLPGDFKFSEIKWPLDAQLFVLPDQFVMKYYGVYAPFLALSRCQKGYYPEVFGRRLPQVEIPYTTMESTLDRILLDYPIFYEQGMPVDFNANYPSNCGLEVIKSADWVDSTYYEEEKHGFRYVNRDKELSETDEQIYVNKAIRLALKLIMAISCRPSAVEHGSLTRPMKVRNGKIEQREMWGPNIIGRTYRIPRQMAWSAGSARRKPRFTFRRGHYAWAAKRFKDVEFVSVDAMPRKEDGTIDFSAAGTDLTGKFHAVHERVWIEGILFGAEEDPSSTTDAKAP